LSGEFPETLLKGRKIMQDNNWREHANNYRPLVNTGREMIELKKRPDDLDYTKTIGGTTYVVKSHFNPQASESMLRIILRWMDDDTNVSEQSL
jgi:hypothetical protein